MIARTAPALLRAPALVFTDGGVETVKWFALACMLLDHVNKYLLDGAEPALFALGRFALPLFGFALAYNLARPGALARGAYRRLLPRLAAFGVIASPFFIALGGLGWGWWPLNIMFTLFVAAAVLWLLEVGSSSGESGGILAFLGDCRHVRAVSGVRAVRRILVACSRLHRRCMALLSASYVAALRGMDRRHGFALPDQR